MSAQDVIDHLESRINYSDDEPEWSEADYLALYLAPKQQNARFVDDEHNDFLLGTPEHPGLFE